MKKLNTKLDEILSRGGRFIRRNPVVGVWIVLIAVGAVCWSVGFSPL